MSVSSFFIQVIQSHRSFLQYLSGLSYLGSSGSEQIDKREDLQVVQPLSLGLTQVFFCSREIGLAGKSLLT